VISQLSIRHFKAITSATIPLGPITVLVGPNDSGKSTILQALMALSRCGDPARFSAEQLLECPPSVVATQGDTSIHIEIAAEGMAALASEGQQHPYRYVTSLSPRDNVFMAENIQWDGKPLLSAAFSGPIIVHETDQRGEVWAGDSTGLSIIVNEPSLKQIMQLTTLEEVVNEGLAAVRDAKLRHVQTRPVFKAIADDLGATLLRLDARSIARPSLLGDPLLPDGSGLVGIVDELLTSGVGEEQIGRANEVIRKLSPHVKGVAAKLVADGRKELHFALRRGAVIPASQISDGIVLAAALVLISLRSGNQRLLIEEPENGLHPRQLKVIADTIRSIAETQGTQIILTTHSPLLLNHFAAEEVLLVTRDQSGVHVQRMSEARGLDDLASEMALGELWYNVGDNNLARPA